MIYVLLEAIARVDAVVEPLEHVVEVLLRRRLDDVLREYMLHLHLKVVLREVFEELLADPSLI